MSTQGTTLAFVKGAFYKTCFCIGLGTASYYSYGQVQNWVAAPTATISKISAFQEKVDNLISSPSDSTTIGLPSMAAQAPQAPTSAGYRPNTKLYLIGGKKTATTAVAPVTPVDPNASPSPAADVAATGEKKDGEVAKEEEKKEGETQPTIEGVVPGPGGGPVNALGLPAYYPAPVAAAEAAPANPSTGAASAAGAAAGSAAAAASIPSTSGVGGVGAGFATAPAAAASGANDNAVTVSTANTESGTASTSTTTTASSASSGSTLSATDITQLTGSAVKASFTDQTESVSGLVCSIGADNSANDCLENNHYSVHTDRWDTTYGLSTDASFSIASTTKSSQIQVDITLKFQDLNQNMQSVSLSAYPTEVLIQTEVKNGKTYKVYEVKLPDQTALNGDKLTSVVATLVYEESTTGTGAMSTDSAVTFTRSHVQTTGTAWDLTGQNRAPAANEQVIVANSLSYTMNLVTQ